MGLFRSLFGSKPAVPTLWTYAPGGVVWRMVPSEDGVLVGEDRYKEDKRVLFFCLDLRTGKELWSRKSLEEPWWLGIEATHQGLVFVHEFARPDMPEHTGIIALDLRTGDIRWMKKEMQFRGVRDGVILGRERGALEDRFHLVKVENGEVLREVTAEDVSDFPGETAGEVSGRIRYPSCVSKDDAGWDSFESVADTRRMVGECEAVEVDERRIFCYHAGYERHPEQSILEHRMVIVDARGRKVYEDILHDRAHLPVYDAFFVLDGRLCYVRKERELVCLDVAVGDGGT